MVAVASHGNTKATGRDMVISLAVLLVPVLLIVWFFTRTPDAPQVDPVDWQPTLAQARQKAGYPVLAPSAPPAGWKPVKARFVERGGQWVGDTVASGNRWELGFLSTDQIYIGVNQSDEPSTSAFLDSVTRSGRPDGMVVVEGHPWEKRISDDGRTRSLVRPEGRSTAAVVGDADYPVLQGYASLLTSS
ncbi:Uncharacterised protein [Acidipropionibacterium jensenii]|uniref:DUF4245 domain-containing protein n=1 Tax=Acidipropionibacterium jensenii TaxID=1749 RepID=A0A3S4UVS3_9ACTN|nr:Uncharacterised protein [Acidipropionibacterium jensenii]